MIKFRADVKELKKLEGNLLSVGSRLHSDISNVQRTIAEEAVHIARTVIKPDIKYGSLGGNEYRTGLLNRSYSITQSTSSTRLETHIRNDVPYFDAIETGKGYSVDRVKGFFHPTWKTATGNQMFIHTQKGKEWVLPRYPIEPFRMMGRTIGSVECLRDYTRLLEVVQDTVLKDLLRGM